MGTELKNQFSGVSARCSEIVYDIIKEICKTPIDVGVFCAEGMNLLLLNNTGVRINEMCHTVKTLPHIAYSHITYLCENR